MKDYVHADSHIVMLAGRSPSEAGPALVHDGPRELIIVAGTEGIGSMTLNKAPRYYLDFNAIFEK